MEVSSEDLMAQASPHDIKDGYEFLAYPNRNSLPFREFYQIPEAHTVIRGTLRYNGNPQLVKALIDLGWIDSEPKDWLVPGITWAEIQQKATGSATAAEPDLIKKIDEVSRFSSPAEREHVISGLRWMGLFSTNPAPVHGNLLDTLSAHLAEVCSFKSGERDLVIMQQKFVVEWKDGSTVSIFLPPDRRGKKGGKESPVLTSHRTEHHYHHNGALRRPGWILCYVQICGSNMWHRNADAPRWSSSNCEAWNCRTLYKGNLRSTEKSGRG